MIDDHCKMRKCSAVWALSACKISRKLKKLWGSYGPLFVQFWPEIFENWYLYIVWIVSWKLKVIDDQCKKQKCSAVLALPACKIHGNWTSSVGVAANFSVKN